MKYLAIVTLLVFATPAVKDSRNALICQKWQEVGWKDFGGTYQAVRFPKTVSFKKDGTYEEIYCNLPMRGQWKWSPDSSKFGYEFTVINGKAVQGAPMEKVIPLDTILRLTRDTLIYGKLAHFGPGHGSAQGYGHDASYFVRVK